MVTTKNASFVRSAIAVFALVISFQASSRTIKEINILESGVTTNTMEKGLTQQCKQFKPTIKQIKNFFSKAYPVPRRWASHERYAPCYAAGTIIFDDFGEASWSITSGGVGGITWAEGDTVILFYKNNKWIDPTSCSYGLGDTLEC
jgi:hypothetical protein